MVPAPGHFLLRRRAALRDRERFGDGHPPPADDGARTDADAVLRERAPDAAVVTRRSGTDRDRLQNAVTHLLEGRRGRRVVHAIDQEAEQLIDAGGAEQLEHPPADRAIHLAVIVNRGAAEAAISGQVVAGVRLATDAT